jgi:hypothetical protein
MTSGPGITSKTDSPDDAIEEISGLLEMDELKASEAAEGGAEHDRAVSEAVGEALDVALETPSPVNLDAYLPPPPVSEEPAKQGSGESESGLGSNMAYEDLLEKLVLPAQPAPVEELASHLVTPRPSTTHLLSPPESLFPSNVTPGPATSDERTVVTVNPLLAEEQEAAARGAESYILPAAPPPQPLAPNTPVVVTEARPAAPPKFAVLPGKIIQTTTPIFGGIAVVLIVLGVLVGRASSPTKVIEKVSVVQTQPVAAPAAPAQAAQPGNPSPEVVPLPARAGAAQAGAQPAAAVEPAQPAAAQAGAEETPAEEAKPEPKPKAHHASKPAHSAKAAAKPVVAAKPAAKPAAAAKPAPAAKPAGGKKPGKGWVDPFAN